MLKLTTKNTQQRLGDI